MAAASQKPAEPKKEEAKNICGLHPEAFRVLIVGPLAVATVIVATVFMDVGKHTVAFVQKHWTSISVPLGKFLTNNVDAIVLASTLATFAPLAFAGLVVLIRATRDLKNFPDWQKLLLFVLVSAALATTTYYWKAVSWTSNEVRKYWNKVSDPIEDILATKVDSIIAGAAILCLAPIGAALIMYALRAMWNCRIRIVVEPTEEEKKKGKA